MLKGNLQISVCDYGDGRRLVQVCDTSTGDGYSFWASDQPELAEELLAAQPVVQVETREGE